MRIWLTLLQSLVLFGAAVIALNLYSPLLLTVYELSLVSVCCVSLLIALLQPRFNRLRIAALLTLGIVIYVEAEFYYQRHVVLTSPPALQQLLGQHIILGYQQRAEIKHLLDKQLVSGVFLTRRNIRGLSLAELQALMADLRDSPVRWLATDQEGGMVQRLSPPLPRQAALGEVVAQAGEAWHSAVTAYAQQQAQALAELGFNLNFAPVVDLPPQAEFWDQRSFIAARALGEDANTITQVAHTYSATLLNHGVLACLKHFPGLGNIHADTHFFTTPLTMPLTELYANDWQPFQQVSQQLPVAMMLAHVQITALDEHYPASFSPQTIALLRDEWQHQGLLITDDFSMLPVVYSRLGIGKAAVQSLNSGVDLLLIGYDYRLFYRVMYTLLQAHQRGELDVAQLQNSQRRQQRMIKLLENN